MRDLYLLGFIDDEIVANVPFDTDNAYECYCDVCEALLEVADEEYGGCCRYYPYQAAAEAESVGKEFESGEELWLHMSNDDNIFDSGTVIANDSDYVFHFYVLSTENIGYMSGEEAHLARVWCDENDIEY